MNKNHAAHLNFCRQCGIKIIGGPKYCPEFGAFENESSLSGALSRSKPSRIEITLVLCSKFLAIGFRKSHIVKVILFEVMIFSLSAGVLGFFAGVVTARFITPLLSMTKDVPVRFSYFLLLFAVGIAVFTSLISNIPSAIRAARVDPTTVFRSL